ncbi:MAG: flagellar protein FlgN [Marinobacterium sp.]|nr:flagellar protein FlgN [Marinobacterium sp.]
MTAHKSNDLLQLPQLFQKGIGTLSRINELLEQEREAIVCNDVAQLESIVSDKRTVLTDFAVQKNAWTQLISTHASSPEDFFESLPVQAFNLLRPHWNALEEKLQEIQQLNERNAQIIAVRNRQVEQLLSTLKGHRINSQLYSDGGSHHNYGAQSRIGKA